MTSWKIDVSKPKELYPNELLQKYADALTKQTEGILAGQVTEAISSDSIGHPRIVYAFYVYLAKIKQSYRLFEVEQIKKTTYPVNLRAFYYTDMDDFNSIPDASALEAKLDILIASPNIDILITHFFNLSKLKKAS